ncbi:hypothetical protein Q1695_012944 [Nippostrongylus brasiliensis]|nr:hypothetical protein Q1695_012944 [Nippostrongylus brasiliensis]
MICHSNSPVLCEHDGVDLTCIVEDVKKAVGVHKCVKKAIDIIATYVTSMLNTKDEIIRQLRDENDKMKEKLSLLESSRFHSDSLVSDTSHVQPIGQNPVSDGSSTVQETERRRSIVVGGIPELRCGNVQDRVAHDYGKVRRLLDFLGVANVTL